MDYLIIALTTLVISSLSLFSGFGLSTVLVPAFALFFPVPVAVAAAAIVHLANNLFKLILVGRDADWGVVLRFALPAAIAAVAGAGLLTWVSSISAVTSYRLGQQTHDITAIKVTIGILIIVFALFDLVPRLKGISFDRKYLPFGGLLSGFFGGLSGNQGALRSAFLIKTGLTTEVYVGTASVCSFAVDVVRLVVYSISFYSAKIALIGQDLWGLVSVAILCAFVGSLMGARLLKKVTIGAIQCIIGVMLLAVGVGLAAGIL